MDITTYAGYTVTIGAVATFLTQYVKKSWFPEEYRALLCRLLVATVSVVLNGMVTVINGGALDTNVLISAFFSYVVAAAAYDHLWK